MRTRNFSWNDLATLVPFLNLVRKTNGDDRLVTETSLRKELGRPGLTPEENCHLFEDDLGLMAYSLVHPELRIGRTVLEMAVHPERAETGLEREVIRASLARSKELGAEVLHTCVGPSRFMQDLLTEEGFRHAREYWLMRWQESTVPTSEIPSEFTIDSMRPGEEERLTRVQNAAFTGSWGFCPNTVEEVTYTTGMSASRPEGILFLTRGQDTAAYCWTYLQGDPKEPFGVIGMIGVDPRYRGQGLSKPILFAGMEYLSSRGVKYIALDVDGENVPARSLYLSVGFTKVMDLHWFEAWPSEP